LVWVYSLLWEWRSGTLFDLVRRITESGLPFTFALKILLLKMPEFIVLAFPMSILLAALMAYSR
jgi:lipopolysaccharide export system permease protein